MDPISFSALHVLGSYLWIIVRGHILTTYSLGPSDEASCDQSSESPLFADSDRRSHFTQSRITHPE